MGLIVGSGIWISILIITIIIMLVSNENIWLKTLVNDLPGLGFILALIISLQIWGLLPQPVDSHDEQISTQNSDTIKTTEEVTEKNTDKEENDRENL